MLQRKLAYTGSYIEEYIERGKVKIYYSWFKKYNHLFKNTQLDSSLVDSFEDESKSASKDFERITRTEEERSESDESEDESIDDPVEELLVGATKDVFEPCPSNEHDMTFDQTSMFLNKYCENTDIPSVANRVADAIVEYEVAKSIP